MTDVGADRLAVVPEIRPDVLRREVDGDTIVWSPLAPAPSVLDPAAAVMLDVIDGEAPVGQLAQEVSAEVGIPLDLARRQVERVVDLFDGLGVLTTSTSNTTAEEAIAARELFVNPCTSCVENAVRGMTLLRVEIGDQVVGVACDSQRAVKALRSALDAEVVRSGEVDIGFVLNAPAGFQRTHQLTDRSGFVLSEGRGLDSGLHALASHLTAFLPPKPGTVRFRVRSVVSDHSVVLCLFPHLLVPPADVTRLRELGFELVHRLAVDIDFGDGHVVDMMNSSWTLGSRPSHDRPARVDGARHVRSVISAAPAPSHRATRAGLIVDFSAVATHGSAPDVLDAATTLALGAEVRTALPDVGSLTSVLF